MHHTLALTRSTTVILSTHVSSSAGHSGQMKVDDLASSGHTVVFAFGGNRKGQCGITDKREHRATASSVWEPAALAGFSSSTPITDVRSSPVQIALLHSIMLMFLSDFQIL